MPHRARPRSVVAVLPSASIIEPARRYLYPSMRSLIVADEFPWPAETGYRIRLDHVIRGLAAVGPVDLVAVLDHPDRPDLPPDVPIERVRVLHLPPARRSVAGYLRWVAGGAPRTIAGRPWSGVRAEIPAIVDAWQPDVVWWSHADVYGEVGDLVARPAIVDFDNLEDRKLRDRRRARRHDLSVAGRARRSTCWRRNVLDRVDERRWRRRQRSVLRTARAAVVCSALDRARLDSAEVVVVPNGYDPPADTAPRAPEPATFTLIGLFTYEPNLDAAHRLVRAVLPRVREQLPDARVRLVGEHDGALDDVAGPNVTVTGPVGSVAPELARATAVVVPMRFGGGTRLKVLEAFACRRPGGLHRARGRRSRRGERSGAAPGREPGRPRRRVRRGRSRPRRDLGPGGDGPSACWEAHFSGAHVHAAVAAVARGRGGRGPHTRATLTR